MKKLLDECYNKISRKILDYGRRYIKDDDNIMALEIDYIVHQEFARLKEKLSRQAGKNAVD